MGAVEKGTDITSGSFIKMWGKIQICHRNFRKPNNQELLRT